MKKLALLLALMIFPAAATATCTWTQSPTLIEGKVVCTTANESAPTTVAEGWQFSSCLKGMTLFVCADSGATLTGTGNVKIFVWNPVAALWGELPGLVQAIDVTTSRCNAFAGLWTVVPGGRIAAVPVSVAVSAGGFTAWMSCN